VFNIPGGSNGDTLDGDTLGGALSALNTLALMGALPAYVSPFSGHVSAIVMSAALAHLNALYVSHQVPTGVSVNLADASLGSFPLITLPIVVAVPVKVLVAVHSLLAAL
jgi:hypothetical protein